MIENYGQHTKREEAKNQERTEFRISPPAGADRFGWVHDGRAYGISTTPIIVNSPNLIRWS